MTDGRRPARTNEYHHTIIHPIWRRAYKKRLKFLSVDHDDAWAMRIILRTVCSWVLKITSIVSIIYNSISLQNLLLQCTCIPVSIKFIGPADTGMHIPYMWSLPPLNSSDWEGKGPCTIVPLTWKMAHKSLCRMIRNGPLKISKSLEKVENGPFDKNLFQITAIGGRLTLFHPISLLKTFITLLEMEISLFLSLISYLSFSP